MRFQIITLLFSIILFFGCHSKSPQFAEIDAELTADSNSNFSKANSFLELGMNDSSFVYFDLASDDFIQAGDSLHAAICLIQMAITLSEEADYYAAQETSLEADKLLDTANKAHLDLLSFNYNSLGNAISGYGDNEAAIFYYDLAVKYAVNKDHAQTYKNNKAVTLFEAKRFKEAFLIHKENLKSADRKDKNYARCLSNYANTRWRIDEAYNPLPDLHTALKIRESESDDLGVNSTLSHLFEYHDGRNLDSAKIYASKSYALANKIQFSTDQINAAEKLIRVNSDSSKYYFEIYKHLSDSVRTARLKAKNQYALIRYEAEKNKIDNLKLQKDVLDRDLRISKERIIMVAVIGFVLSALTFFILWAQRRKQRITMEAENKVKEIQLTTSKKVHDVVANGIYRVMTELEHRDEFDKSEILDKLEVMYEKSRDISYESSKEMCEESFATDVSTLIRSFANENIHMFIVGNDPHLWHNLSKNAKNDLLIILQEILVNMRKHSQANEVIFRFEERNNYLHILYQDNGVGLTNPKKMGNGIRNTGNRMERLKGKFNFASEKGKGVKIEMNLPLPQN